LLSSTRRELETWLRMLMLTSNGTIRSYLPWMSSVGALMWSSSGV
jgi:hypothetical protein